MAVRIVLNAGEFERILQSTGLEGFLRERADRARSAAAGSAPVSSGAYRDSIRVHVESHPSRVSAHVGTDVPYAMLVEARTGNLARALDAAGGS